MGETKVASELPRGWALTTLGNLVTPTRPKVSPSSFPDLPFIGMEHVEAHTMRLLGTVPASTMKSNAVHFLPRDVLYGRLRPYLNKVLCPEFEGLCSSEFIVFPASENLYSKFIQYFLNTSDFVAFASRLNEGDRPRVDFVQLAPYPVKLPPLLEQYRIVAKIEELFSDLDAGIESFKKARAQLKRYRQAVLKAAVTGELTQGWRETHRGEFEPAADLLARILQERRAKWEAEQLAKMQAVGKPPKNDDWKKKYQEPAAPNIDGLPELPSTWCWASLESIADAVGGYAFKSGNFSEKGKHQVIKMANVRMGKLNLSQRAAFLDDVEADIVEKYSLRPGDVLVTLTGTRKKRDYGFVVAIKEQGKSLLLNQRIARLRPSDSILPTYLEIAMQSETYRDRFFSYETGNVGQGNVGMAAITVEAVAIAPFIEQQQIVSEVERALSIGDATERTIEQSLKQAERLRQSILQQAFAGKLVPQDPTEEPAESLLARIKAERAQNGSPAHKSRRPTRIQKQPAQPNMLP